ncbi:MAG: YaiI/YqxD family protein [Methylophilaceae bacterium]
MQIWVDADACPVAIKEILFKAAQRTCIQTTLVANRLLQVPASKHVHAIQVDKGFDVADNKIVELLVAGDLVITADIPLAAQVVAKGGHALNPRGEFYSKENIQERLSMRNLMEALRSNGVETSGPSTFHASDKQAFSAKLDQFLTRNR